MTTFNWSDFLRRWSQEILESAQNQQTQDGKRLQKDMWLGYPGATEEQILAAEARLGIKLPPSYRAFLKVSNGWRETTPFIKKLWSTEAINWFAENHPTWLHQWRERYRNEPSLDTNGSMGPPTVSDEDYLTYGEEQDCRQIRIEYLEKALEISDVSDASVYLLNPEVVTEDGEWEAWFLADWLPGADRYPSFRELMQAEYINSREIRATSAEEPLRDDTYIPLGIDQSWSELARDNVQELIQQAFSSLETFSPETLSSGAFSSEPLSSEMISLETLSSPETDHLTVQSHGGPVLEDTKPSSPTQIQSQQWPGIEVDKVCEWIVAQVEHTVCP